MASKKALASASYSETDNPKERDAADLVDHSHDIRALCLGCTQIYDRRLSLPSSSPLPVHTTNTDTTGGP